mgnify:CR=1 FL=1
MPKFVSVSGSNSDYGFIGDTPKFLYWAYRSGKATHTVDGAEPIYTRNLSYYGRFTWSYGNRYVAQVSLRADAADSSVLPIDNRWGYFPAVSLAWTLSNEQFWSGLKNALPYVKLRASWGANGSTASLGDYSWASSMVNSGFYPARTGGELTDYKYIPTYIPAFTGNKKLKWESSQQLDFGADLRFFNDRLTVTADYYSKNTKDLIISGAKPSFSVGNVTSPINAGEIVNGVRPEQVVGPAVKGMSVAYTGDTKPCKATIEAVRGVDVLIHEATYSDRESARAEEHNHSTAVQAARIAEEAGVSYLIMTHISHRYEDRSVIEDEAREVFPQSYAAEDMELFTINRGGIAAKDLRQARLGRA